VKINIYNKITAWHNYDIHISILVTAVLHTFEIVV